MTFLHSGCWEKTLVSTRREIDGVVNKEKEEEIEMESVCVSE